MRLNKTLRNNKFSEPGYLRFSWIVLLAIGAINLVDGIDLVILGAKAEQDTILKVTGISWTTLLSSFPNVANYINNLAHMLGFLLFGFSFFIILISVFGFRKGKPWP